MSERLCKAGDKHGVRVRHEVTRLGGQRLGGQACILTYCWLWTVLSVHFQHELHPLPHLPQGRGQVFTLAVRT